MSASETLQQSASYHNYKEKAPEARAYETNSKTSKVMLCMWLFGRKAHQLQTRFDFFFLYPLIDPYILAYCRVSFGSLAIASAGLDQ